MGLPFISRQPKRRDEIVAIDLGAYSTKAVHLRRSGDRFSLVNYAIVQPPNGEKSLFGQALVEHLKQVGAAVGATRSRLVTVALGVNESIFRQVEVPLMPLDDMRLMLKHHSKNYLQQDLPEHVFDCYYIPTQPGKSIENSKAPAGPLKQKIMVGGAKEKLVQELAEAIQAAGLQADQIVPGIIGPTNAFEMAEPEIFAKEAVALVELGYKSSHITILDCGEIKLNRVVSVGGERITAGLAEALNISAIEAENIKIGMPNEVQPNLESLINPLGRELRASVDFFEHQHDKTLTQVFVSGAASRSEFILQCLQNEMMVPCKSWNPARILQLELSPEKMGDFEQTAPQLTVALGAAATAF